MSDCGCRLSEPCFGRAGCKFENQNERANVAVDRVVMPFKVGDWIIYDAIGKGVYEVVEVGVFFFDVKLKRLFEGGKLHRLGGDRKHHVTNINRGGEPIDYHNLKCKVVKVA